MNESGEVHTHTKSCPVAEKLAKNTHRNLVCKACFSKLVSGMYSHKSAHTGSVSGGYQIMARYSRKPFK